MTLRSVSSLLAATAVKDLRFFGGKLGTRLEEMDCKTAGDVQHLPISTLIHEFGEEKARYAVKILVIRHNVLKFRTDRGHCSYLVSR